MHRTNRWISLALLLHACSATDTDLTPPRPGTSSPGALDPAISEATLQQHIRVLADDRLEGRETGTPGCREAARYLAGEFARIGLRPGGDFGTYYQHFVSTSGRRVLDTTSLHIGEDSLRLNEDFCVAMGVGQGTAEGELVFAGHGIAAPEMGHDDYADLDVEGRVVVVLAGAPGRADGEGEFLDDRAGGAKVPARAKMEAALAHKAAGLLFVQTEWEDPDGADRLPAYFSDRGEGLSFPALRLTQSAGARLLARAGHHLASLLEDPAAGLGPLGIAARIDIQCEPLRRFSSNVIGVLPGQQESLLVVGAHYDHLGHGDASSLGGIGQIHNGADDNASGCAGLLEIAEALAAGEPPRHTLVFLAFSGEELGLHGSAAYLKARPVNAPAILAMVNLDMIGRSKESYCAVGPVAVSPEFADLPARLNRELGLGLKLDTSPKATGVGSSDHQSFLLAGVPSLTFFSGLHEDYHRPSDDVDKINAADAVRIARLALATVQELDLRTEPLAFVPPPQPEAGSLSNRASDRPWFGSVPDYAEQGEGVLFSGVMAGSPAEKAGLLAGDRLVELDGQPVRTLEDFVTLLRTHAVGDTLPLVVIRDGERVDSTITLAVRQ